MRDAKITQIHEGRNSSVSLSGGRCSEPWAKLAKERHAIVVTCNVRQREKPGCRRAGAGSACQGRSGAPVGGRRRRWSLGNDAGRIVRETDENFAQISLAHGEARWCH